MIGEAAAIQMGVAGRHSAGKPWFSSALLCVTLLAGPAVLGQEEGKFFIGGGDWEEALGNGDIQPVPPDTWDDYMMTWELFGEGEPYPPNDFLPCEPPTGGLYVWEGGGGPQYPESPGLVMYWDVPPKQPGSFSSAYYYVLGEEPPEALLLQPPVNLNNTLLTVTVNAPQFDLQGNQINVVSMGLQDVNGLFMSWSWTVGASSPPSALVWNTPTTITITLTQPTAGMTAATPTATGFTMSPGFQLVASSLVIVDENSQQVGGGNPIPPPGGPPGAAWNYWYTLSIAPLPGPGGGGGPPANHGPVSFSVNGPLDPHYEGLPMPGTPLFNPPYAPPPPPGPGPYPLVRFPLPPPAVGIQTFRPGDVNDYMISGVPSEAEIFQSEPDLGPAGAPNGTNNQIMQAVALGLLHGQDNINAYTFGEDFFNGDETPIDSPDVDTVWDEPWEGRGTYPGFAEPVVASGGLPIMFFFSVDPWAIGLPNTAVQNEATLWGALFLPPGPPGSADVGALAGPWQSNGEAAGDVFFASPITAPGINWLDHDEAPMALLAPRPQPPFIVDMEDDLDAMEHVGTNAAGEPGNTHDRVLPTSGVNGGFHPPDLGDPFNPNHDPVNVFPLIFSVDRGSYGAPGSAVDAQVSNVLEGASGDLFIAVTLPPGSPFPGTTTNMLLIDEGQLGLMPHDDLDAVIVLLLIDPADLEGRIQEASENFVPFPGSSGFGFLQPLLNPGEAVVGFSVDNGSIGLVFTAVDFECRVDGMGLVPGSSGVVEHPGDVFFSNLTPPPGQQAADPGTTLLYGQNYLWFEEITLGLDRGIWTFIVPPGPSGRLEDLPDELNALDSLDEEEEVTEACCMPDGTCLDLPPNDCLAQGGNPQGPGTQCTAPEACCFQDGSCQDLDPLCCLDQGGIPQGAGTDCTTTVCPAPPMACCLPDGSCIDVIWMDCVNQGGDPQGPGTSCATTQCNPLKWAQPPTFNPDSAHPECLWGWDEISHYNCCQIMADDWPCTSGAPMTDLHWWGSYVGWDGLAAPPFTPDLFHIGIWTNVPAGLDQPFSHPGTMLWEWTVPRGALNERPVACDWHPEHNNQFADGCFRYDFFIPQSQWFYQEPSTSAIYWVSIAALYQGPPTEYPWGWKTREHFFEDDAVKIFLPVDPTVGSDYIFGEPLFDLTGISWDMAFVITTLEELPEACCFPDGMCLDLLPSDCVNQGGMPQGPGTQCTVPEACCLQDGTCIDVDPLCCDDLGGMPQGPGTQCTVPEACCLPDGTCVDVDPLCCDELGGIPQGPGLNCSGLTIACCLPDGTCVDVEPLCCDDLGGVPSPTGQPFCLGDTNGNTIDDACELPEACCLTDGTCLDLTPAACANLGGTTQGAGTQCGVPEACCLQDGTCLNVDPLCCDDLGGIPQGAGFSCTVPEACCLPDGTCVDVDPLCCDELGGIPQGPGTACSANTSACCLPNGTCVDVDPLCCDDLGGVPSPTGEPLCLGDTNGNTIDDACELPEACCLTDGTCIDLTPAACGNLGGMPQGAGSQCTTPVPCCLTDGSCLLIDPLCCDDLGGAPSPTGSAVCAGDASGNGVDDACETLDSVICEPQGGTNPTHPPTYWYDVSPEPTFGICDFHVRVFDASAANYTNIVSPAGWSFVVHQPDGVSTWASWWDPDPACPNALFWPNTFRFQFDHPGPSQWSHWRTTIANSSDPDDQIKDRSENHAGETDGLGYRVHAPLPPAPIMACCLPDGTCTDVTWMDCVNLGGDPQGPGTDCTTTDCNPLKWAQPPTFNPESEHPECLWGWDEISHYNCCQIMADDWPCTSDDPITDIHWWGSYVGWEGIAAPPIAPDLFHIGIWTNVPAGVDDFFSHPGTMLWEWTVPREELHEHPVACDWHPEHNGQFADSCFRYDFFIPESEWFYQEPDTSAIYWVSISAQYLQGPPPEWPWGWKTREHFFEDDAVRIFLPMDPTPGADYLIGEPLTDQSGETWDLAFVITTTGPELVPKWLQPVPDSANGFDAASDLWWPGPGQPPPVQLKWSQPPEPSGPCYFGWDERSDWFGPWYVADDWVCTDERPVTDVHWWGSYYGWESPEPPPDILPDGFHIGVWTDVPAGVDFPFSHPEMMVHEWFVPLPEANEIPDGCDEHPDHPFDATFHYTFNIPEPEWFYQDPSGEPTIYWLSIAAMYPGPVQPQFPWGWKTRPFTGQAPDVAVRVFDPLMPGLGVPFMFGEPIFDAFGPWDMAFELTTVLPEVNKAVADDFISDGRPIEAVRWWGSYFDDRYAPDSPGDPVHQLDGWFITFHHQAVDVADPTCPPDLATDPPPTALGVYYAPASAVTINGLDMGDCLGHGIYEYEVDLSSCCLLCAEVDPRDGTIPADPDAFLEKKGFVYWLDVQAVTGVEWLPPQCVQLYTGHLPSDLPGTNGDFWGWLSSYGNPAAPATNEEACRGRIMDFSPYPPGCWDYGLWEKQPWECPTAPMPVHMSFALLAQPCLGELNGIPPVNASDLAILLGAWGPNPGNPADLNKDGIVDATDLALLLGNWGCGLYAP